MQALRSPEGCQPPAVIRVLHEPTSALRQHAKRHTSRILIAEGPKDLPNLVQVGVDVCVNISDFGQRKTHDSSANEFTN
jgi:hypothetical protein